MTELQERAFREFEGAMTTCMRRSTECDKLGLGVFAMEYDYFAKSFAEKLVRQRAALEAIEQKKSEGDGRS